MGAGWVARARHIPSLQAHPGASVVALYDTSPERAAAAAATFRIPWSGADRDAFFDRRLDAVSICTSPWSHAELAIEALSRGLHVFCEKPMAMNVADAQAMVAASTAAGRSLCLCHNFLWSNSVRRADRLLTLCGPVSYAMALQVSSHLRRLPTWYRALPGGLFFDESPHMLYLLQHFMGPLRVDGVRATPDPETGHPATLEVQLQGTGGAAALTMLFDTPLSEWHIGLVGSRGVIDVDLFREFAFHVPGDGAHKAFDILGTSARTIAGHARGVLTSGTRLVAKRQTWGHGPIIGAFVESVVAGAPPPVAPESALAVVEVMEAILEHVGPS
jgi:predicted dehydrogenase